MTEHYGNGSDTSCLLPLAVGIVPAARQAAVEKRLVWLIRDHQQGHVECGLIGMQWVFQVLSRIHQMPLAWAWLNSQSYPSYGYMIAHGATTIWENWNGNTAGPAMNSMNHVMFIGDMLTWLYQDVGGIRSSSHQPGFHHIIMRPLILHGLTWVKAWHRSPYGKIVSAWKIKPEGVFKWHIRIPANSFATVEIPARAANSVRLNGHLITSKPWIKFVAFVNGRAIYLLESGNYHFRSGRQ